MKRISGYLMAVTGFILLIINAIGYIFGLDFKSSALTILGLVFVVIGMGIERKKWNARNKN
jgi:hypothetical protein